MNARRGFLRLWLVATVLWVFVVGALVKAPDQIESTYLYYFDHDATQAREAPEVCRFDRALQRSLRGPSADLTGSFEKCVQTYKLERPKWGWLGAILLPPTLGVALVLLALWAVFGVFKWVWKGFKP